MINTKYVSAFNRKFRLPYKWKALQTPVIALLLCKYVPTENLFSNRLKISWREDSIFPIIKLRILEEKFQRRDFVG